MVADQRYANFKPYAWVHRCIMVTRLWTFLWMRQTCDQVPPSKCEEMCAFLWRNVFMLLWHGKSLWNFNSPPESALSWLDSIRLLTHYCVFTFNTSRLQQNGPNFAGEKFVFAFIFHWNLFLKVQSTTIQHSFRYCLVTEQVTSHHLIRQWPSSLTYLCVTPCVIYVPVLCIVYRPPTWSSLIDVLTQWGRVTHIWVGNLIIIG